MPLYVYRCNTCGETFEKMVRLSESDQKQVCPNCSSLQTEKMISSFAAFGLSGGVSSSGSSSCGGSGRFT
jgi:putative FmdB family regulatory protein